MHPTSSAQVHCSDVEIDEYNNMFDNIDQKPLVLENETMILSNAEFAGSTIDSTITSHGNEGQILHQNVLAGTRVLRIVDSNNLVVYSEKPINHNDEVPSSDTFNPHDNISLENSTYFLKM